jgi:MoxR-like ATPase
MASSFQALTHGETVELDRPEDGDRAVHQWSRSEIDALILAQAAQRPLLVRGEPGTGKTQLARAVAQHLGWRLLPETIHPRFEAQDLIYRFDAVRRLADAHRDQGLADAANYWEPGPLWRAYGWASASLYGSCRGQPAPAGHVILIDEIDKADSDLPNSLLEVLGQRSFSIPALQLKVGLDVTQRPLVLITTNEERELPPAFMRRCVVLNLAPDPTQTYRDWLVQRGQAHFSPNQAPHGPRLQAEVITAAADQLMADRNAAVEAGLQPPGPAEFLDLLYALHRLAPGDAVAQQGWMRRLSAFAFIKHGAVEGQPQLSQTRAPLPASDPPAKAAATASPRGKTIAKTTAGVATKAAGKAPTKPGTKRAGKRAGP